MIFTLSLQKEAIDFQHFNGYFLNQLKIKRKKKIFFVSFPERRRLLGQILLINSPVNKKGKNKNNMKKRNILLSVAFMAVAAVAFLMSGNLNTTAQNNDQLAYQVHQSNFDGKCGEGKCGTTDTKSKDVKAKKSDEKSKCGEGKCGEGKTKKDSKMSSKSSKDAKAKCGEGKCGEGKADKDAKTAKSAKKTKCGDGK
jgi:uncharacterized low-complexity protein